MDTRRAHSYNIQPSGRPQARSAALKKLESSQMTVHAPLTMTKEAFFAWIGQREERYEYAKGRVVMMVYVTRNHARVTKNLVVALATRLSADSYDIVSADFAVDVGESVRFPDVLVEPRQADGKALEAKLPL